MARTFSNVKIPNAFFRRHDFFVDSMDIFPIGTYNREDGDRWSHTERFAFLDGERWQVREKSGS